MNAVETRHLSHSYRDQKAALLDVDLAIPAGCVFALLGPNGAGKTTALKALLNLITPQHGDSLIFGQPSTALGAREFQDIGYVSEGQQMPLWMTVEQFLSYCAPLYPRWDHAFAARLLADFDLPPRRKLRHLSRGMRMKAALLSALAFHPRLLVLDEPFSGLDPIARDEFVTSMLAISDRDKWTVLISSHDIAEVERLVDWVGILQNGKLSLCEPVDDLQARFRRVLVSLSPDAPALTGPPPLPDPTWLAYQTSGHLLSFIETRHSADSDRLIRSAHPGCDTIEFTPMDLREIFVAFNRQS